MANKIVSILPTLVAISAVGYAAFIIYQVIQTEGYSSEVASGIATVGLVIVTIWYAWSTGKLTSLTQEQIRATKAAYAPNLNTTIELIDDRIEAKIENTGNGPAKSLTLDFDIVHDRTAYRYRADFESDVGPGSSINTPGDDKVVLIPKFKVPESQMENEICDKLRLFIFGNFGNLVTGISKIKEYDELISDFRSNHSNPEEVYPQVHFTIRYTDIIQEKQYSDNKLQDHRISLERDSLGDSVSDAYEIMHHVYNSPENRTEYLRNIFLGNENAPENTIRKVEEIKTEQTSLD